MEPNPTSKNREPASPPSRPDGTDTSLTTIHLALRQFFSSLHIPPTASPVPLLLAVSGGPDSLCMADAIITLQQELHVAPVIAHLDHQLRGEDAHADARFVQAFAQQRQVPCIVEAMDVAEIARAEHLSIEVAARQARYHFLGTAAQSAEARYIVLAHHAGDQAETVLLRLLRGTGIYGLRGMRPTSPLNMPGATFPHLTLLRPLLTISRAEIERYCQHRNLVPRHDATNDELHHTRNRIRHELLPLLEQYNPGIRKVLVRLAETATTDTEIIEYATQQAFQQLVTGMPTQPLTLNRHVWQALPVGLQRTTLREAVRQVRHNLTDLKFAGVEEARDVLNSTARSAEIAILDDTRIIVQPNAFAIVPFSPYN
jgi:tRNA(Ile)-lysidine synthetase-like protein